METEERIIYIIVNYHMLHPGSIVTMTVYCFSGIILAEAHHMRL